MAGAQSAAAVLQAEQGDLAAASVLLEGSQMEDGVLTLRYDADWQPARGGSTNFVSAADDAG